MCVSIFECLCKCVAAALYSQVWQAEHTNMPLISVTSHCNLALSLLYLSLCPWGGFLLSRKFLMINRKWFGVAVTDRLCVHLASTAWAQTGGEGVDAEERRTWGKRRNAITMKVRKWERICREKERTEESRQATLNDFASWKITYQRENKQTCCCLGMCYTVASGDIKYNHFVKFLFSGCNITLHRRDCQSFQTQSSH